MLISSDRCQALISRSNSSTCSLILRNCAPNADRHARAISGIRLSFGSAKTLEQFLDTVAPDRCNDPELGKMGPDWIDRRGLLTDEQMARTVQQLNSIASRTTEADSDE